MTENEWFIFEKDLLAWRHRLSPRDYPTWNLVRTLLQASIKDTTEPKVGQYIIGRLVEMWKPKFREEDEEEEEEEEDEDYHRY